jgi:hypothetical protein
MQEPDACIQAGLPPVYGPPASLPLAKVLRNLTETPTLASLFLYYRHSLVSNREINSFLILEAMIQLTVNSF